MVAIVHTARDRLAHEMMIDVRTEPMCVGERIARTRRDQQTLGLQSIIGERFTKVVAVEGEPALQATSEVRVVCKPSAMRRQPIAIGQPITSANPLERKVGQRRGRFANGEPWVTATFEKHHVVPKYGENARQK